MLHSVNDLACVFDGLLKLEIGMFGKPAIALLFAVAISSGSAFADFSAGMSAAQLETEARAQVAAGRSAADIAKAGLQARVNAGFLTTAMLLAGINSSAAITGLVSAGGNLDQVVGAAFAAGIPDATITTAATGGGAVDEAVIAALARAHGNDSKTRLTGTPNPAANPGAGNTASPN
jgi:hypothetical protein